MAYDAVARKNGLWASVISAGVLLADQLTKLWAVRALDDGAIELFWEFRFKLVKNSGTIFGLGNNSGFWLIIVIMVVVGLLAILVAGIVIYKNTIFRHPGYLIGYALMLGGALGNLGDRLFRAEDGFGSGSVVDFVDLNWWPVFNVADSAITIGIAVILWTSFSVAREVVQQEES